MLKRCHSFPANATEARRASVARRACSPSRTMQRPLASHKIPFGHPLASAMTNATSGTDDLVLLDDLARAHKQLIAQIGRRIVGQHAVVDNIVAALLSGGHALLVLA